MTQCPRKVGRRRSRQASGGRWGRSLNGRQLPPSILTRALWGGSQAGAQLDATRLAAPALPRQGRGASTPRPVLLLQRHPGGGTGKKGRGQGRASGRPGAQLCPCRAPLPFAGGRCRVGPAPAHLQTLCPIPSPLLFPASSTAASRPASSKAQLLPGRFSQLGPRAPGCLQPDFQHLAPKEHSRRAEARLPDLPWVMGRFCKCSAALDREADGTRPWGLWWTRQAVGLPRGQCPGLCAPSAAGIAQSHWEPRSCQEKKKDQPSLLSSAYGQVGAETAVIWVTTADSDHPRGQVKPLGECRPWPGWSGQGRAHQGRLLSHGGRG